MITIIIIMLAISFLILLFILAKMRIKIVLFKEEIKSNLKEKKHNHTDNTEREKVFWAASIRVYSASIIKRLQNCSIKELVYLLLFSISLTTFFMASSHNIIIPYFLFGIFSAITVLTVYLFPIFHIKRGFERNSKMETYFIVLILIIYYSIYTLKAFTEDTFKIELFYIWLIPAVVYYLCLFIAIIKCNLGVVSKFLLLITLYTVALSTGSFIFGTYYCFTFPNEYQQQIIAINSIDNYWEQIKLFACIGLPNFFSLPDDSQITSVSIFQYFWGKALELCFLGYIVAGTVKIFAQN